MAKKLNAKPTDNDYVSWLAGSFGSVMTKPLAPRHHELWKWFTSLELGRAGTDYVHNAPRGGGKSAHLELGVVYVGVKGTRKLALYVSRTQDQSNKHIQSIRKHLESLGVQPLLSNYGGTNTAWRVDMLRCANGFTALGIGIDTTVRGLRIEDIRPDIICLDDIDSKDDSKGEVAVKIRTLTDSILPSGSDACVTVFGQNIIHDNSIMAQVLSVTPPFITTRVVGCNEPAVLDMVTEEVAMPDGTFRVRIVSGTPSWVGQSLETCNRWIEIIGVRAFLREMQHHVKGEDPDALFNRAVIERSRLAISQVPKTTAFRRIAVGIDIAVSTSLQSDTTAIVVGGVTHDNQFYIFLAVDGHWKPAIWAKKALDYYKQFGAARIAAEKNQGGNMIESTIHTIRRVPVDLIHVHKAKEVRAEPVAALYEMGRVHHLGVLADLEEEMISWVPGTGKPSPNLIDALVILLMELDPRIRSGNLRVFNQFMPSVSPDVPCSGIIDEYDEDDYSKEWPKATA